MWIRISEGIEDPPVHGQQVKYLNPDTGQTAVIQYYGSGTGVPVGYWITLPTVGRVFDVFPTLAEAKVFIGSVLQPFYVDLP